MPREQQDLYYSVQCCAVANPAHSLNWWHTEAIVHLRWARRAERPECRAFALAQAREARATCRRLRLREPGVSASDCRCEFVKMWPDYNPWRHPPLLPEPMVAHAP